MVSTRSGACTAWVPDGQVSGLGNEATNTDAESGSNAAAAVPVSSADADAGVEAKPGPEPVVNGAEECEHGQPSDEREISAGKSRGGAEDTFALLPDGDNGDDSPATGNSSGLRMEALLESINEKSVVSPPEFVERAVDTPQSFLTRSKRLTRACRLLLRTLYNDQTAFNSAAGLSTAAKRKKRARVRLPLGPLPEAEVGELFEVDQIWEEVQLRNRPLGVFLDRAVEQAMNEHQRDTRKDALHVEEGGQKAAVSGHDDHVLVRNESHPGNDLNGGEVPKAPRLNAGEGDSEYDTDAISEELPSTVGNTKKVRFSCDANSLHLDTAEENGGTNEDRDGGAEAKESAEHGDGELEDGFFSIADMEAFAGEAEELAKDGRLMGSDEDEDPASPEDDGESNSEGEADGILDNGKLKSPANLTAERLRYSDFFDQPEGEGLEKDGDAARALRRATLFEDNGNSSESELESEGEGEGGSRDEKEQTPLEQERAKLQENLIALEDANVSKKPWQLRGEVDAHGRPLNSLLGSEFEHDIVAKPKSAPSAEATASIEDIIRQRVFDSLYDDVVRKLPADYETEKQKRRSEAPPEISQERPAEGLAELYEREYAGEREKISKAAEAASGITVREEDPAETPEQTEINKLFKRLSNKLDALASLHFTPSVPKLPAEMEVKPNVAALNAEEAIPEAVSNAALLAPHEVHAAKESDLQGDIELNKEERRTRRRTKKRRIANENKAKVAIDKQKEMSDPSLAAERRAERTLQRPGKLLKPVKNPNEKKKGRAKEHTNLSMVGFDKSQKFFAQLQQTVEADLAGKKPPYITEEGSGARASAKLKM